MSLPNRCFYPITTRDSSSPASTLFCFPNCSFPVPIPQLSKNTLRACCTEARAAAHLLRAMGSGAAQAPARLEVALAVDAVAADEGAVLPVRPIAALGFAPRGGEGRQLERRGGGLPEASPSYPPARPPHATLPAPCKEVRRQPQTQPWAKRLHESFRAKPCELPLLGGVTTGFLWSHGRASRLPPLPPPPCCTNLPAHPISPHGEQRGCLCCSSMTPAPGEDQLRRLALTGHRSSRGCSASTCH